MYSIKKNYVSVIIPCILLALLLLLSFLLAGCGGNTDRGKYTEESATDLLGFTANATNPANVDSLSVKEPDTAAALAWNNYGIDEDISDENAFCGIYYDAIQAVTNDYAYSERIVINGDGITVHYNDNGAIGKAGPFTYTLLSDDNYDYLYFQTNDTETGHKAFVRFGSDVIALLTAPNENTKQTVTLPNNVVVDAEILVSKTQFYIRKDSGEEWPQEVNADQFWGDSNDMFIKQPYYYYPDCKLLICTFSGISGAFYVDDVSTLRSANDIMLLGVDPNEVQGPLNLADGFYLWGTPSMHPVAGALAG